MEKKMKMFLKLMTIFQLKKRVSRDLSRCIGAAKSRTRSYRGRLVFLRAPSIWNIVGLQPPATLWLLWSAIPFLVSLPHQKCPFLTALVAEEKADVPWVVLLFAFWLRSVDDVAEVAWGCGYGGPQISEDCFQWPAPLFLLLYLSTGGMHAFLSQT